AVGHPAEVRRDRRGGEVTGPGLHLRPPGDEGAQRRPDHRQRADDAHRADGRPTLSEGAPRRSAAVLAEGEDEGDLVLVRLLAVGHAHRATLVRGADAEARGEGDRPAVVRADPVEELAEALVRGDLRTLAHEVGRDAPTAPVRPHPEAEELAAVLRVALR